MSNSRTMNSEKTKTVAVTGLMIAVTAIMSFVPFLGTIMLPWVSITIAFLPAIITVMILGFAPGVTVAAAAGIFSLMRALIIPTTWLSVFLQNPLVSVAPRIMIAVTVFLVFRVLIKTKLPKTATIAISAAVGSITNTVGVLGMVWLLYAAPLHDVALGGGHASVWALLMFIVTSNALLEVVGNTFIATMVVLTLMKAKISKI